MLGDLSIKEADYNTDKNDKFVLDSQIKSNAKKIDQKLKNIKVCDPAIGSGAFPVGLMQEIVRIRFILSRYIQENKSKYDLKRHAIQESIYGVDIDSGAVEIAKLRLWLSLVVEEENIKDIKPLPNLDFKIMQGNSLIEEFNGIKLNHNNKDNKLFTYNNTKIENLVDTLKDNLKIYFNASARSEKARYKEKIDKLIIKIFEEELKHKKQGYFNQLDRIKEKANSIPNISEKKNFLKKKNKN